MPSHRARHALPLLVAALLLGACGSPTSDAPVPGPPAPDPLVSAVTMSRSWGSATADIIGTAAIDGRALDVRGTGDIGLDKSIGLLWWSMPDSEFTELVTEQAIFERVGDGLWTRTELSDGTATSALVDPLRGLSGARVLSVTDAPEGGRVITAEVAFDATTAASLAIPESAREELLARAPQGAVMSLRVEVDPHHRITRVERAVEVSDAVAQTTVDLSDYAVVLGVAPPPSASVRP